MVSRIHWYLWKPRVEKWRVNVDVWMVQGWEEFINLVAWQIMLRRDRWIDLMELSEGLQPAVRWVKEGGIGVVSSDIGLKIGANA